MDAFSRSYDTLNRVVSDLPGPGNTNNNGQSLCWSYDSFGNRTAQDSQTTTCPTLPSVPAATVSYSPNNRIYWVSGLGTGEFLYDGAGNVTQDNLNWYLYDAEGRICAVENRVVGTIAGYLYNAEGNRIGKGLLQNMNSCDPAVNSFSPTNDYILGQSGEEFTEMTVSGSTATWAHTNAWAGGEVLATYNDTNTYFALRDWLGTKRVELGASICVTQYASMPYGDGLTPSGLQGYPSCLADASGDHFTGKERDTESGNDYFGARYFGSSMGRFMSPDYSDDGDGPQAIPYYNPSNPQTLNLYSYAGNNVLSNVDDDGHDYNLLGGSQCGSNGVNCDSSGYVLGSDGNRQVVTDAQTQNGGATLSQGANGGVNVTTGQGTFAAVFFDASPGAVSATVSADPPISGFSQSFIAQTNAYNQGAKPLLAVMAGNALAGVSIPLIAEIGAGSELTTLGNLAGETTHSEEAALLARHGITPEQARAAIEAAKKSGNVVEAMGRYGPQLRYTANGIRVVVATTGRNAGKIITAFFK